ncbi:MAG: OstA-like protein [Chitinophagaceae bacterium]
MKKVPHFVLKVFLLFLFLIGIQKWANAQQTITNADSVTIILIQHADDLHGVGNDSNNLQKLVGNVILVQGKTVFSCDSAYLNKNTNTMDAFSRIHIHQDSVDVYSDSLHYLGNNRLAILKNNVSLTDGRMNLTTQQLDYDLNSRIGIYSHQGKLINGKTVLTSTTGYYYANTKDAYFKNNVLLVDPQYTLRTDTLLYNTRSKIATFVAPTQIISAHSIVQTPGGYYDSNTGQLFLNKRSTIIDSAQTITADSLSYDKMNGVAIALGHVITTDTVRKTKVLSNYAIFQEKSQTLMATQKPLLIYQMEKDTLYLTADTLFSGIQTTRDSFISPHPVEVIKKDSTSGKSFPNQENRAATKKDSVNQRYFLAFHHVKIFSDSLQGKSDSLYYSFKDSIFRLFQDPVIWTGKNQLTADTLLLFTKNKEAHRLLMKNNAMIINQTGPQFYNQIQGRIITGYFKNNQMDWMHVDGNAESIYFAKDDQEAYVGVAKTTGAILNIYFKKKALFRIVFIKDVKSTFYSIPKMNPEDLKLRHFKWRESERPSSRKEMMQ